MDISIPAMIINIMMLVSLALSFMKSKEKSLQSLMIAVRSLAGMTPYMIIIVLLIGIMRGFLPEEMIIQYLGESSGFGGVVLAGIAGVIFHVPALVSFPLAASLIESGAGIMVAAAFITTLTMVSLVTLPVEIRELGWKMAMLRNLLSFVIALFIAVLMGVVMR